MSRRDRSLDEVTGGFPLRDFKGRAAVLVAYGWNAKRGSADERCRIFAYPGRDITTGVRGVKRRFGRGSATFATSHTRSRSIEDLEQPRDSSAFAV